MKHSTFLPFYLTSFFSSLLFIAPLYMVMFKDFGVSPTQSATLLSIWSISALLLEIPSGAWADYYSRKKLIILSRVFFVLGPLPWLLFPTFWGFVLGFVFSGIGSALHSGTYQSLTKDTLAKDNASEDYEKVTGYIGIIKLSALSLSALIASLLVRFGFGYSSVLILTVIAAAASLLSSFFLPSPVVKKPLSYLSGLITGIKFSFSSADIFRYVSFLFFIIVSLDSLEEYYPLLASEYRLPQYGLGVLLFLTAMSQAGGTFLAHKLKHRLSDRHLYGLFLLAGLSIFASGTHSSLFLLLPLLLFAFSVTLLATLLEARIMRLAPEDISSTVYSFGQFLASIGVLFAYFFISVMSEYFNYALAFVGFGIIIAVISLYYLFFARPLLHKSQP